MHIEPASFQDAAEILALQRFSYQGQAELYGQFNIPPLTQTLDEILLQFGNMVILKAVENGTIFGSVRAYQEGTTAYIGRLFVHPERRCHGIGADLMDAVEAEFPAATRFELFTDHRNEKIIRFYQRLGYRIFRHETVAEARTLAFLEKIREDAACE